MNMAEETEAGRRWKRERKKIENAEDDTDVRIAPSTCPMHFDIQIERTRVQQVPDRRDGDEPCGLAPRD
jgi:hypothetical protein